MTHPAGKTKGADSGAVLGAEFAPAKINLALHVTGRRADGYHELDSLVVFAGIGDTIEAIAEPGALTPALRIEGPFAAGLDIGPDNLVLRAARAHQAAGGAIGGFGLRLIKNLPVASGIGGGSADAAATLRLLGRIAPLPAASATLPDPIAATLGADVPMCLRSTPLRATGIGDRLTPARGLPRLPMLLVNPRAAVSTPAIFRALARADHAALPDLPADFADAAALAAWLHGTRNDLEAPAIATLPVIADGIAAVGATEHCLLARMSGSGATVFGIYPDDASAARAAERLAAAHPDWWIASTAAEGSD
ncbi:4-diphosphocytidyl-2-C-methyl-D-erythritol kinase [Kaistia sp. 32K]|uniref:4-(cytidine 5'-diphospho)-2-C-methyl-D-erythritol kinase n=1 Tax=Kaistia sp. 32K TaxID=2795690 RepID=UPI00191624F9|nr:4-(cytidine 5'-diphospho)-2-C-methyl-D-erythritol kinase [Kaistia sp. 32K]BCP52621.1 4-diphosphocytidyl-2-C-methyl-D-erythritol kinase [Kaistia sp. 32K]